MVSVLALLPIIFSTVLMAWYWYLYATATNFNAKQGNVVKNAFDLCGEADPTTGQLGSSQWTLVFILNAIVYTLMTFFTLSSVLCLFVWRLFKIIVCGHLLTWFAHFGALIATGVFRYTANGLACAEKDTLVVAEDLTMADVGATLEIMFIVQCVLFLFVGLCKLVMICCARAETIRRREYNELKNS